MKSLIGYARLASGQRVLCFFVRAEGHWASWVVTTPGETTSHPRETSTTLVTLLGHGGENLEACTWLSVAMQNIDIKRDLGRVEFISVYTS